MAGAKIALPSFKTDACHPASCPFTTTRLTRPRAFCSVSSRHGPSGNNRSLSFVRQGALRGRPLGLSTPSTAATAPKFLSVALRALGDSTDNASTSNGKSNNALYTTVLGYVISIIKGIIGVITKIPGLLKSILSKEKEIIEDIGESFDGVADAAEELVKGIAEVARVVEHAADSIADAAEEAEDLLAKVTGNNDNGIADLARAIEHAADTLADSAEEANALLEKVEAQAEDITNDVITAVENLEEKMKPLQEAVKNAEPKSQNVEVNISLEKTSPVEDSKVVVQKVDAKVIVEKVDGEIKNAEGIPENGSVEGTVEATVTITQPDSASKCEQISWTSQKGLHISSAMISMWSICLSCANAAYQSLSHINLRILLGAATLAIILCFRSQLDAQTVSLIFYS